jgi:UDP-N-acetyl-2-amino-2-deoxyglucuronate dehydrogenase
VDKRILIVGAGSIGLKHLRSFNALEPKPHMVAIDPRPEALAQAEEMGAEARSATWEQTDLREFDGVVICAPAPMHVPYSMRCLREGVPVLSEKPLSHNWDGVEELLDFADRDGTPPSGVAYVRRYHPAHETACRLVRSGDLGPITVLRVNSGQPFTTYRPDYRQIYYASREQGGGCMLDFASHFIDLVQWYLGPIKSIKGHLGHLVLEGVEVEDTCALSFEFDKGALGTLHINQYQPLNENCIEFCGEGAVLRIIEPGFTCRVWRRDSTDWEDVPVGPGDYFEALRRQAAAFIAAIDGGPAMRTSFAEAARTLRLCMEMLGEVVGG